MMPPSKKRGASALDVMSTWATVYETIRSELEDRGLSREEAAKTAAYIAASLVREIEVGYDTRKH